MMKKLALISSVLLANACGSVDTSSLSGLSPAQSNEVFLRETNYQNDFDTRVLPLIASAKAGYFQGAAGIKIFHQAFVHPNAKAKIVIVNGFTENTIKYRELIYNFYQSGYSVYIYDHRGQGASDRIVKNDAGIAYIDSWSNMTADMKTFVKKVVPQDKQKTFIFAHSMGGAIVADALLDSHDLASAVALSSPALALKDAAGKSGEILIPAHLLAKFNVSTGQGQKYGLYQDKLDIDAWTLESSSTSSPERFQRTKLDVLAAEQAMGGASWGWQKEVLGMNTKFSTNFTFAKAKLAKALPASVKTPILMGQAGKDSLVFNPSQNDYCKFAPTCNVANNKIPYVFVESKHELYNEKQAIRNRWITQVIAFFDSKI